MKGRITIEGNNPVNRRTKKLTLKNISSFRSCISKINNTVTDSSKDLDIAMPPMCNQLGYSDNYSMTLGSLRNYNRVEVNDEANEVVADCRLNRNNTTTSKSLE